MLNKLEKNNNKPFNNKSLLRFDGFYRTDKITHEEEFGLTYYSYLLFCENGVVLSASSVSPSVEKVAKWLNCGTHELENLSVGKYLLKENKISFTATSVIGKVEYEGKIQEDKLILHSFSHINKNTQENQAYKFIYYKFDE